MKIKKYLKFMIYWIFILDRIQDKIFFNNDEKELLISITEYHIEESYPAINRKMPSREEIKEVLDFTEKLFDKVCKILDIDKSEVTK